MEDYKPNEIIIDKACELWVNMISNPRFNALGKKENRVQGDDPNGSMAMAQGIAAETASRIEVSPESFDNFAATLKALLMSKTSFDNERKEIIFADDGWYQTSLGVDYHPEMVLSQAAKQEKIPHELFPWKTNMYLSGEYISLSYGYGAEPLYYYPFDDKWLITTLRGTEISKVIEYIKGGKPEFTIQCNINEESVAAASGVNRQSTIDNSK